MRMQVTATQGISLRGIGDFRHGEEFELPDDRNGRVLAAVLIGRKRARKFEPVVIGNPPPLPPVQKAQPVAAPPESTPEPSAPPPVFQPDEDTPPVEEAESSEPEGETEQEGDAPRRRGRPPIHGRYSRRDIRAEE